MRFIDSFDYRCVGKKFGERTQLGPSFLIPGGGQQRYRYAIFECECGHTAIVQTSKVNRGLARSCAECHAQSQDGLSRTGEYRVWSGIIARCTNPSCHNYKHYGGRGIEVCKRWRESFKHFLLDVGSRPGAGFELDRIDNNGNYEPENVQWLERWAHRRKHGKGSREDIADVVNLVCAHWG